MCICSHVSYAKSESLTNIVRSLSVTKNEIHVTINKRYIAPYLRNSHFFVHYDDKNDIRGLDKSILLIPFITFIIPLIWVSDKQYSIDVMDYDLYHSLIKIKNIFKKFYPSLSWSGELIPKKLKKNRINRSKKEERALLFSGGLDSAFSSLMHNDRKQLLITLHGVDIPLSNPLLWKGVQSSCLAFGRYYGHENVTISTNMRLAINNQILSQITPEIPSWWAYTLGSLSHTGVTAPLLFIKGHTSLLIGSTRTVDSPYPFGTHPLIDNNVAFAGIRVHHDGSRYDRVEKLQNIRRRVQNNPSLRYPSLRACGLTTYVNKNCESCEKCLRTMNEIWVSGETPNKFGFKTNFADLVKKTKHYFSLRNKLSIGLLWHWECIQKHARIKLKYIHKNSFKYNYYQWLSSLNIRAYKDDNVVRQEARRSYFTKAWQTGII